MNKESATLQSQYQLRFKGQVNYRNLVWQTICRDIFQYRIPTESTIVDVGAGWGEFVNNIQARNKYAIDLNPDTGKHLSGDVSFINQNCAEPWPFSNNQIDVVFTSNFLEHLPDKGSIERVFREAWRCLKQGGLIICMGPNIKYLPGAYWDFWDHALPLTDRSVAELMSLSGFVVDECVDKFIPYSMSTGFRPPILFVKLYLRFRLAWSVFGKQFLVIGHK